MNIGLTGTVVVVSGATRGDWTGHRGFFSQIGASGKPGMLQAALILVCR